MFSDFEREQFKKHKAFEVYKLHTEYFFYINFGEGSFRLGLKIYEMMGRGFYFIQSHHVHTPIQIGPYHTSRALQDTFESALYTGLDCITSYIKAAEEKGHKPDGTWFVPNEDY